MNRLLKRANQSISFGGAATLLVLFTLLGQMLGFLRNRLISTNITRVDPGASDAFFAAFQIPDFFFYTIAAGALGVAFIPMLSDRLSVGDKKGVWNLANSLLNLLFIVMAVVSVVIFIFAEPFIHLLAPNLDPENQHQAITIMRFISLNPLLFTLSGILTSVQQTFGRFFFYAVAPLFYNVAIIVSIFLFRNNLGVIGLGVGALAGGIIQFLVAVIGMFGLGYVYRPIISWNFTPFRRVLKNLPPRSLDQGIDQINSIVEINRAQALGKGPVSYYSFALTLMNVPVMMLSSIAVAAFPRLTERLSQHRTDLFRRDFLHILGTMIWLTMPVITIAYFCRGYLARLIFGDFAPPVALIFGYLTVAIFFRVIYSMVSRYFYAYKDTNTPLYVSIFAIGLNIVLAFSLSSPDSYGIAGLALAQSIVAMSEVLILGIIMVLQDRKLINKEFIGNMVRILSVTGFTLLTAYIMTKLLPLQLTDRGFITLGGKLAIISSVTFLVHIAISSLFELEEAQAVLNKTKQIIVKPIRLQ